MFEIGQVGQLQTVLASSSGGRAEAGRKSENTNTVEQKLTKGTKEFGRKPPPQASWTVLAAFSSPAIFFTSLPSRPSVQNLLFFVFSNFRVFLIGFHRYFPEGEVPENHESTKNAAVDHRQTTNRHGSRSASSRRGPN